MTKEPTKSLLLAPISAGELLDKITILLIKAERIADPAKRRNVMQELASLTALREQNIVLTGEVEALYEELASINRQLWDTEDRLRQCERDKRFDDNFIELARNVYQANDRRAAVKRQLNQLTGSPLVEEKSYL
jgi:predicted  nucleic acid-binding Zn-ribbon protein